MSDELMEMRKKKHALETKIKHVNREIEVINEEIIRSFQKHLKGRFCRNDAYLFMLQEMKNKGYWVLNSIDLGYDQAFGFRDIYSKKFLCYNISTLKYHIIQFIQNYFFLSICLHHTIHFILYFSLCPIKK